MCSVYFVFWYVSCISLSFDELFVIFGMKCIILGWSSYSLYICVLDVGVIFGSGWFWWKEIYWY